MENRITSSKVSRRDFLKAAGVGAGAVAAIGAVGGVLSSCSTTPSASQNLPSNAN